MLKPQALNEVKPFLPKQRKTQSFRNFRLTEEGNNSPTSRIY